MENTEPVAISTAELPQNGQSKTAQLSSNRTLFWRVFLPVFGTVFLTGLTLAFWFIEEEELFGGGMPALAARIFVTLVWLGWLFFVFKKLWQLKRVDANDTHFFVSNYWQTARYAWSDVASVGETRRLGRQIIHIELAAPGRFGRVISFLPGSVFQEWMSENGKSELLLAN